jgi:hypothetical protein
MSKPSYVPAEALNVENIVSIALWSGKVFPAAVVDVLDNGERLHIVRLHEGRVIRREILTIGYGYGNIRAIGPRNCKHLLKGTQSDRVLPAVGKNKIFRNCSVQKLSETRGIIRSKPSQEFLAFKKEQENFFRRREIELEQLNQKIIESELNRNFGGFLNLHSSQQFENEKATA